MTLLLLTNCEKNNNDINTSWNNQRIFFQYEYINFAWGRQHSGWLIDSSGYVYCYDKPDNWYYEDSSGFINVTDMDSNILSTDSICFKIDKKVLYDKINLIHDASKGKISEPIHEKYDAGSVVYYGFIYYQDIKAYKKVLLKQIGDYRIENGSYASFVLYKWLDTVNNMILNLE